MLSKFRDIINTKTKGVLFSNFLYLSVIQGLNLILPFVTVPYLLSVLGVGNCGLIAFALAFVNYFQIISDYGFNLTATRDISMCRDDKAKVQDIYNSVTTTKILLLAACFVVFTAIVYSFEVFSKDKSVYFYTYLTLLGQAFFPIWFFQGMQKMKYITYINLITKGIFTLFIFLFVKQESDYWMVPLINAGGFFLVALVSVWYVYKEFGITYSIQSIQSVKNQLIKGKYVFLSQFKIALFSNTNILVLGLFAGNIAVGYFTSAEKIIRAIAGLQVPVVNAIFPYISIEVMKDKLAAYKKIIKISTWGSYAYFLMLVPVFIFSDEVIKIVFQKEMHESAVVIRILAITPLTIFLNNMFGTQILLNLKNDKLFFRVLLASAMLNLLYLFPLTSMYSYIGTSVAMLLTETFLCGAMMYYGDKEIRKV